MITYTHDDQISDLNMEPIVGDVSDNVTVLCKYMYSRAVLTFYHIQMLSDASAEDDFEKT